MNSKSVIKIHELGFPWITVDPFLFCVHHLDFYPVGDEKMQPRSSLAGRNIGNDFVIKNGWRMYHGQKIPGFPVHPHRGFETITVVKQGLIDHSDSLGATARFGNGDVQWLTAGKGIQHSEMFPLVNSEQENTLELFQIWLNLPARKKFAEPNFTMLWAETIPDYEYSDINGHKTKIKVIVGQIGSYHGPKVPPDSWAANSENQVAVWTIKMEPFSAWKLPGLSDNFNRTIYFYEGKELKIDGNSFAVGRAFELNPKNDILLENGEKESSLLFLQGKPIAEPVSQYGPFVMNQPHQIQDAFLDYQRTQFGGWPWKNSEPVHSREKGRFAIHADGFEEIID